MPAHQRASLHDAEDHAGVTILDAAVCGTNHVSMNTYHEITTQMTNTMKHDTLLYTLGSRDASPTTTAARLIASVDDGISS